jgi:hypothetical protein
VLVRALFDLGRYDPAGADLVKKAWYPFDGKNRSLVQIETMLDVPDDPLYARVRRSLGALRRYPKMKHGAE